MLPARKSILPVYLSSPPAENVEGAPRDHLAFDSERALPTIDSAEDEALKLDENYVVEMTSQASTEAANAKKSSVNHKPVIIAYDNQFFF